MRSMPARRWITALAVAAAFVAGVGVDEVGQREAQAQAQSTATMYVPSGGLVFRAADGTVLARLSRDAHGGTFELYDDRHQVSMRVPKLSDLAANPYVTEKDSPRAGAAANPDDGF